MKITKKILEKDNQRMFKKLCEAGRELIKAKELLDRVDAERLILKASLGLQKEVITHLISQLAVDEYSLDLEVMGEINKYMTTESEQTDDTHVVIRLVEKEGVNDASNDTNSTKDQKEQPTNIIQMGNGQKDRAEKENPLHSPKQGI